jgi:hypothetical protein
MVGNMHIFYLKITKDGIDIIRKNTHIIFPALTLLAVIDVKDKPHNMRRIQKICLIVT